MAQMRAPGTFHGTTPPPRRWQDLVIMAALVALVLLPVVVSMLLPPPLAYANLPFPVLNSPVTAGTEVFLDVRRCTFWRSRLTYTVTHELHNETNGAHYLLPSTPITLDPGCSSSISTVNVVPTGVPPGIYTFSGTGRVSGWLRTFDIPWVTQPFEVVAPTKEAT